MAPWDSFCTQIGDASGTPPKLLCPNAGTSLTIAIASDEANDPAIYTLPPVLTTPSGCIGFQLDTANRVGEGPVCVAVRASDKAGNVNTSTVLRLCIDGPAHLCNTWPPATLPDCTGTLDKTTSPPTVNPAKKCLVKPLFPAIEAQVTN